MSSQFKITHNVTLTKLIIANSLLRPTAVMADASTSTRHINGIKIALARKIDAVCSKRPCPYMSATMSSANTYSAEDVNAAAMNITRPVASIMRRRPGNETDARESSGNVAANKIVAGEVTMPNMLREAPYHPTTDAPAKLESNTISKKG
jgi:hypothetical protein